MSIPLSLSMSYISNLVISPGLLLAYLEVCTIVSAKPPKIMLMSPVVNCPDFSTSKFIACTMFSDFSGASSINPANAARPLSLSNKNLFKEEFAPSSKTRIIFSLNRPGGNLLPKLPIVSPLFLSISVDNSL